MVIRENRIRHNTAGIASAGQGGGIALNQCDRATIIGNTIEGNTGSAQATSMGGGLHVYASQDVAIRDNQISDNVASVNGSGYGGGVYVRQAERTVVEANRVLSNTTTPGGSWGNGGGLHILSPSSFTMTNNIVAANHAFGGGGGLYLQVVGADRLTGTLVHNTLAVNDQGSGTNGSTALYVEGSNATLVLTNNLVYHHTYGIYVGFGSTATLYNTLFYANSTGDTGGAGTVTNTAPITGQDPLLDADYHLRPGSPAVDAGAPLPWLTADIDGDPRPIGTGYDIGADEVYLHVFLPLVLRNFP